MPDDQITRAELDTEFTVDIRPDRMVPRRDEAPSLPPLPQVIKGPDYITRTMLVSALLNVWHDWKERGRRPSKEGPFHDLATEVESITDVDDVTDEMAVWQGRAERAEAKVERLTGELTLAQAGQATTMAMLADAAEARALRQRCKALEAEVAARDEAIARLVATPRTDGAA